MSYGSFPSKKARTSTSNSDRRASALLIFSRQSSKRSAMRANLTMSDRQTARARAGQLGERGRRDGTRAEAEDAQGLGDTCPEAQGRDGRAPQDRPPCQAQGLVERLRSGCTEQVAEHRIPISPVVVAPRVLVQVALQPRRRDAVVDATDRVLSRSEEPFDRLGMRQAIDVDPVAVADRPVLVLVRERPVATPLVRVKDRPRLDVLPHDGAQGWAGTIRDRSRPDATVTLDRRENHRLVLLIPPLRRPAERIPLAP